MKLYLASPRSFLWYQGGYEFAKQVFECKDKVMQVFLAGCYSRQYVFDDVKKDRENQYPYILESFYYIDENMEKLIPYFGDFLLDSGAFTFMQNNKSYVDWDEYIERYADFIRRNKIEKFFELDIDSVVGYDKVLEYRKSLKRWSDTNASLYGIKAEAFRNINDIVKNIRMSLLEAML